MKRDGYIVNIKVERASWSEVMRTTIEILFEELTLEELEFLRDIFNRWRKVSVEVVE